MRYLDGALLYIGLGLVCYIIGMWVAPSLVKVDMSWRDIIKDIQIKHKGVLILSAFFILSVVVRDIFMVLLMRIYMGIWLLAQYSPSKHCP